MSTVRYFRHDDAGAPTLTGQVGSLTALLRKCLVGVSGVAYGSKASAGWTEQFIGAASNIAAFSNNTSEGGSGCYALVNDNAPGAQGAREANVVVYSAMTNISTGVMQLKDAWVRKSSALDSTARKWLVVADGLTAWLFCWDTGDTVYKAHTLLGFGDYNPIAASAPRHFSVGLVAANVVSALRQVCFAHQTMGAGVATGLSVMPLTGVGVALPAMVNAPVYTSNYGNYYGFGASGLYPVNPEPVSGATFFARRALLRANASLDFYGTLRGIALPLQNMYSAARGAAYGGDPTLIVCRTHPHGTYGDPLEGSIMVDSVGPWV